MIDSILPMGNDMSLVSSMPAANAMASLTGRINSTTHVDAAAEDFEAMFASQMIEPMFSTIKVNDTFGGGHGEEAMRSFLVQEYGKFIAKTGMLGIAAQVKTVMLRAQEHSDARSGFSARGKATPLQNSQDSYVSAKGLPRVSSR